MPSRLTLVMLRFALRTLRELKLLVYWSDAGVSENVGGVFSSKFTLCHSLMHTAFPISQIISIIDMIKPTSLESFKEVYRAS